MINGGLEFIAVRASDEDLIRRLSAFASSIIRAYYDPIIGKKQNDYHLEKFQSVRGILEQLSNGYSYYIVAKDGIWRGFFAFYPRGDALYLSKFYMREEDRGKGFGKEALQFIVGKAKHAGLNAIELNVNRFNPTVKIYEHWGFLLTHSEQIDIGCGFIMDDYVYRLDI